MVELDRVTYLDDGVDNEDKLLIDVQKRSNSDRNKIVTRDNHAVLNGQKCTCLLFQFEVPNLHCTHVGMAQVLPNCVEEYDSELG